MPLGADVNTAVYRVEAAAGEVYFLKLRKNVFEQSAVLVPEFLRLSGLQHVIPALRSENGELWTNLQSFACILYPYIEGRNGFETLLTNGQWLEFGSAVSRMHAVVLPPDLAELLPVETYSSERRNMVRGFQAQVEELEYHDLASVKMAATMRVRREQIQQLVERAEDLADRLKSQAQTHSLCHADLHAGNLLFAHSGKWYIVDWDNLIFAPKERDLMFIGGGVGDIWNSEREETLFYQGYGFAEINLAALAYYRLERVVEDIAAFCEAVLATGQGGEDRDQSLHYFYSQFLPGGVLELANQTWRLL